MAVERDHRRRGRRVVGAVALIGVAAVGVGDAASGDAIAEAWEPPPGEVFAGPPGDGPHPDDVPLEVGDVVARGTRGPDGECVNPPGGVGVGFTPPDGYAMHVSVAPVEDCTWVVASIDLRPSTGEEELRPPCRPEDNTALQGCRVRGPRPDVDPSVVPTGEVPLPSPSSDPQVEP